MKVMLMSTHKYQVGPVGLLYHSQGLQAMRKLAMNLMGYIWHY